MKSSAPKYIPPHEAVSLKQQGFTQHEIAERLGCSRTTVQKLLAKSRRAAAKIVEDEVHSRVDMAQWLLSVQLDDSTDMRDRLVAADKLIRLAGYYAPEKAQIDHLGGMDISVRVVHRGDDDGSDSDEGEAEAAG